MWRIHIQWIFLWLFPTVTMAHQVSIYKTPAATPVCYSVLYAYKHQHLSLLLGLSTKQVHLQQKKYSKKAVKARIFHKKNWRWQVVQKWNGKKVRGVRKVGKEAICRFLWQKRKRLKEPMAVFVKEGRYWRFVNLSMYSIKKYRKGKPLR